MRPKILLLNSPKANVKLSEAQALNKIDFTRPNLFIITPPVEASIKFAVP